MRTAGQAHYVRHNATTRVPRAFIYLDTEALSEPCERGERQTFRLAVAAHDRRSHRTGEWLERRWCRTTDAHELWEWVGAQCQAKARTVLVAHNLAYDLRIARAFIELPAQGWEFVNGRVENGASWMIWKRDGRNLTMVDSMSWTPISLEKLGELCEIPKLPLPAWEDDDAAWFARCGRDVEILADVWHRLVGWVESDDLGNWRLSGAGQSWAAFRHRFMGHQLLVHQNDEARAAERAAAHTGRCEAWQHGRLTDGPYTEWDFTTAYCQIGADSDVPIQLVGPMHTPSLVKVERAARRCAVLCEVEVETDVPTLPFRSDSGISWPVGRFRTCGWDNEISLAVASGAHVGVDRAWVYRRAPALRNFCTWVLSGLNDSRGGIDPVVRVALKHWSRSLIGRMGMRTSKWDYWGRSPESDVWISQVHDRGADERFKAMQLGDRLFRLTDREEGNDSMVAILSWIMAESRVRLWRAMQTAGLDNVAYVDTDSMIVNPLGSQRLSDARYAGLRIKGAWESIEVLGPRQLILGPSLRAAGIPRRATRVSEHEWQGEVWTGLERSLATGRPDSVEIERRRFHLYGTDNRRIHNPDGTSSPFVLPAREVELAG